PRMRGGTLCKLHGASMRLCLPYRIRDYFSAGAGSAAYRISSGYCRAANAKVSGTKPNSLKLTQKSVDCVRQIASLSTASEKKNNVQRSVSVRQRSGGRWKIESKGSATNRLSE